MAEQQRHQYREARRRYLLRRRITLTLIYGFAPFCAGVYLLAPSFRWLVLVSIPLAGLWACVAWWAIWWSGQFRCPKCRRRYGSLASRAFLVRWSHGLFEEVCPNCRLAKTAKTAIEAQES
jgi:hypothetical protein